MSRRELDLISETEGEECCADELLPPIGEEAAAQVARGFAALADPARLRLFSLIASQPGAMCACSLVEPVGKSQPTVSHHLKVLYEAGLVDRERRGSWIWYRAVPGRLQELVAALGPMPEPAR
ncbi:MAG TPA: metalloregulator ArsR/SmtB family transcription factor [Actinomycetota bacterium]|nr:metalloregulator ArsR/SmtB family transcription factor [Actinomycetota bacterium]